jgi:predicted O-linked N-acetylglucosamine transferase (SPINDLY family)
MGNPRRAAEYFEKALARAPDNANAAPALVRALRHAGEVDAALAAAARAIERQPANPGLWLERARTHLQCGDGDAAIEALERTLELNGNDLTALLTLARVYRASGRFVPALALARRALALERPSPAANALAAELLCERGDLDEAMAQAESAVRSDDASADSHRAMAMVLQRKGDRAAAIRSYETAISRAPKRADLLAGLGELQAKENRREAAIETYRRAIAVDPGFAEARTRLFVELRDICRWDEANALRPAIDRAVDAALAAGKCPPEAPFVDVMLHEDLGRNLAVARGWAKAVERRAGGLPRPVSRADTNSILTVGYLSDELRDHPIGHHVAGLFERHRRDRVRVHAYSYGRDDGSDWARRARAGADRFVDIAALSDADAAARIAADGVHILVDLKGYTSNARLEILALRPAPVQVSWLGFPGSYGGAFIDYALGDRIVTPPDMQPSFAEALCCLPNTYQVNDDRFVVDAPATSRHAHGLPDDGFVFCCFNKAFKIPASLFDLWLGILDAVPGSCLWLWARDRRAAAALRARTGARGIDPDRLLFAKRVPLTEHLRRLELADLALDTMPYNGHATTSNALWAGVPVIAVLGKHFASRVSASLLAAAGLPELAMPDADSYRRRAIELARNRTELAGLRERLKAARADKPFFDTDRFVRNLESAFNEMYARHRRGERPTTLLIEETA